MKMMIPFYYAIVALLFGIFGGFCARCYQLNKRENFFPMLATSSLVFVRTSWIALLLPVLVFNSNEFRRLLLHMLICDAEKNYTVSISDTDKDSLIDVLLEKTSIYDVTKIAASLSWFYFSNLSIFANSIMRNVQGDADLYKIRNRFFSRDISFYKDNIFARRLFCL